MIKVNIGTIREKLCAEAETYLNTTKPLTLPEGKSLTTVDVNQVTDAGQKRALVIYRAMENVGAGDAVVLGALSALLTAGEGRLKKAVVAAVTVGDGVDAVFQVGSICLLELKEQSGVLLTTCGGAASPIAGMAVARMPRRVNSVLLLANVLRKYVSENDECVTAVAEAKKSFVERFKVPGPVDQLQAWMRKKGADVSFGSVASAGLMARQGGGAGVGYGACGFTSTDTDTAAADFQRSL